MGGQRRKLKQIDQYDQRGQLPQEELMRLAKKSRRSNVITSRPVDPTLEMLYWYGRYGVNVELPLKHPLDLK